MVSLMMGELWITQKGQYSKNNSPYICFSLTFKASTSKCTSCLLCFQREGCWCSSFDGETWDSKIYWASPQMVENSECLYQGSRWQNEQPRPGSTKCRTNLIQFNEMFSKAKSCKLEIYMILDLNWYHYYELICLFSPLRNMINMN